MSIRISANVAFFGTWMVLPVGLLHEGYRPGLEVGLRCGDLLDHRVIAEHGPVRYEAERPVGSAGIVFPPVAGLWAADAFVEPAEIGV